MEAPKCKNCGEKHWLREPCSVPLTISHIKTGDTGADAIPAKLKFDRNAYQRDLMRKRRAAEKMN